MVDKVKTQSQNPKSKPKVKTQSQNPKSKPKVKTSPFGESAQASPSRFEKR
ncbi:hypothetical protein [Klebsiella quasipneumoniae]|uniref:hypothetical protein n=1 Tax=Klebsiella quasipneumoniae TaxID=1463165 RepID=UPI0015B20FC9|nr:hypothetical protein [Klebsiella quasipneumoniae]